MKSLAERHLDRAQRKADNAAEFVGGTAVDTGAVIIAGRQFADLLATLPEAERDEVQAILSDYNPEAARSLAEDENGNSMAGIGVVNTKVVPALAEGGNGGGTAGGWVDTPPSALNPATGANANGQALVDQGVETGAAKTDAKADTKTDAKGGKE